MAVPNAFPTVEQIYSAGHYDLTTKMGCGIFIEDCAKELHQHDPRWGHLKKPNSLGGVNHWNHHGVDVVCYRSDSPGQTTAVDLVKAGESTKAEIGWNPDEPRYQASDWLNPADVNPFILPPHQCKLGCSLFWLVGAVHRARHGETHFNAKIDQNLDWIVEKLHGDYVRFFFSVYGIKAWNVIGADKNWSDWKPTVIDACQRVIAKGLKLAPTLVGEGANVPTEADRDWLVDQSAEILKPILEHIEVVEMWNEYPVTGGQIPWLQRMADRFIGHVGSSMRVSLDTPAAAMGGTGESGDRLAKLQAEVTAMYKGNKANTMTPQWDRSEPNPLDLGPDGRQWIYSHEPRGPGASAGGDVSDPLPLTHDYIQTIIQGTLAYGGRYNGAGYLYHSKPGVWGGYCDPAFPEQNEWTDLWSPPNADEIARQLASVRAGLVPDPPEPDVPIPPYSEAWITQTVVPAFVDLYQQYHHPLDTMYPVWIARTQYDHDAGMTQEASLAKHLRECEDVLQSGG